MALTIEYAFDEFLGRLRATPGEIAAAKSHRASVSGKLVEAFGMTSFFRTGSFGNATNISGYSDVDYFAVIPRSRLKADSSLTLAEVAQALRDRFPQTSNIRVNSPGVRVPFGYDGAEATEIVPVDDTGLTKLGFSQFDMPDGSGGWKFSAPESHNAYVQNIDKTLDDRVRPLIRFIKAWKYIRNVPIKSFYLEIRVAHYASTQKSILYDTDIALFLGQMLNDYIADFPDPRFPNDNFLLKGCANVSDLTDAYSKLSNAAKWALEAAQHNNAGRIASAFRSWQLVYDGQFPPYGL